MKCYKKDGTVEGYLMLIVVACIPFSNFTLLGRSLFFHIFIVWMLFISLRVIPIKSKYPVELWILLTMLIYKLITGIWSIDINATVESVLLTSLPIFILTILLFNSIKDYNALILIFKTYVFSCLLIGILLIYNYYNIDDASVLNLDTVRISVFNSNQNELAVMLMYGFIMSFYLLKFVGFNKYMYGSILLILGFSILLTGSRTGFLSLIMTVLFIIFLSKKKFFWILVKGSLILFILYISIEILPKELTDRSLGLLEIVGDDSHDFHREGYRGWIWIQGLNAFINTNILSIMFGTGYESYGSLMYENTGIRVSHHNTFLGYLVELGFFGLFIYLFLFGLLAKRILILVKNHSSFYGIFYIPIVLFLLTQGLDQKFLFYFIIIVLIKLSVFHSLRDKLR
jgi:O-antigen ligase